MLRRGDDRAVSALVGAVLLLGIFVMALSMYQLNVVPNENYEVEVNHNERVTGDMVELRNAIGNAASDGGDRGVSMTLGTQYNTRTFTVNPSSPTGTIQTEPAGQNVTIEGNDITDLNLTTNYILYQPDYNEYIGAPTTRLEHTLLYNEFRDGNVTVEDSMLFRGNQAVVPIVSGDLSRTEAGTVSVDIETLEGPKTESPGENVTITLPTEKPGLWEQSLEDQDDVTVRNETGYVELELGKKYDVTVACIGVGDRSDGSCDLGEFGDDDDGTDQESVDVNRTFDVHWDDDEHDEQEIIEGDEGKKFDVIVTDSESNDPIQDASIDFSTSDSSVTRINHADSDNETDPGGRATVSLDAGEPGDATVYAAAGDGADRLPVTVVEDDRDDPEIHIRTDDLSHVQEDNARFITSVDVENPGDDFERIEVEHQSLDNAWAGEESTVGATRGSIEYQEGGAVGDEYEITVRVIHSDGNGGETVATERTVTTNADADNPVEDDLSRASSPELVPAGTTIRDQSNLEQGARYWIDYEVGSTEEFNRVTGYLVSTESGGAASETETATSEQLNLDTYGYEEQFKVSLLVFDDDGVVVDAETTLDQADGTDP